MFFTLFGYWVRGGGGPNGTGTQLAYALFPAYTAQNIEVSEPYFFDVVITQNDHPRYVKHVLARIYVPYFPPYFGRVLNGVDSLRGGLAEGSRISETDFLIL